MDYNSRMLRSKASLVLVGTVCVGLVSPVQPLSAGGGPEGYFSLYDGDWGTWTPVSFGSEPDPGDAQYVLGGIILDPCVDFTGPGGTGTAPSGSGQNVSFDIDASACLAGAGSVESDFFPISEIIWGIFDENGDPGIQACIDVEVDITPAGDLEGVGEFIGDLGPEAVSTSAATNSYSEQFDNTAGFAFLFGVEGEPSDPNDAIWTIDIQVSGCRSNWFPEMDLDYYANRGAQVPAALPSTL